MNGVHVFADRRGHWWWQAVFVWVPEFEPVGPFDSANDALSDALPDEPHGPRAKAA